MSERELIEAARGLMEVLKSLEIARAGAGLTGNVSIDTIARMSGEDLLIYMTVNGIRFCRNGENGSAGFVPPKEVVKRMDQAADALRDKTKTMEQATKDHNYAMRAISLGGVNTEGI